MDNRRLLSDLLNGSLSPADLRTKLSKEKYLAPGVGIDVHRGPDPVSPGYLVRVPLRSGGTEVMTLEVHQKLFDIPPIIFCDFTGTVEEWNA